MGRRLNEDVLHVEVLPNTLVHTAVQGHPSRKTKVVALATIEPIFDESNHGLLEGDLKTHGQVFVCLLKRPVAIAD